MKMLKIMSLVMGVLVAAAIAVTPLAAMAETQQSPPRGEITLSQEQRVKFNEIREQTIAKIAQVLTPAQMDQFKKNGPRGLTDLSGTQKTQLQKIFESYLDSIKGILTKEQLQQIEQSRPKQ